MHGVTERSSHNLNSLNFVLNSQDLLNLYSCVMAPMSRHVHSRKQPSYLHGIGADNFPLKLFPDLDGQFGLSGTGGSQNYQHRRHHRPPQDTLHAASGRRHDGASATSYRRRCACAVSAEVDGRGLSPGNRQPLLWRRDGGPCGGFLIFWQYICCMFLLWLTQIEQFNHWLYEKINIYW